MLPGVIKGIYSCIRTELAISPYLDFSVDEIVGAESGRITHTDFTIEVGVGQDRILSFEVYLGQPPDHTTDRDLTRLEGTGMIQYAFCQAKK